jgi:hypothetical protein
MDDPSSSKLQASRHDEVAADSVSPGPASVSVAQLAQSLEDVSIIDPADPSMNLILEAVCDSLSRWRPEVAQQAESELASRWITWLDAKVSQSTNSMTVDDINRWTRRFVQWIPRQRFIEDACVDFETLLA